MTKKFTQLLERKYGSIRGAQTKLAEDIGVNQSSVSNWIKGRNFPNPDVIKKMSVLFGVAEETVRNSLGMLNEFAATLQAAPLTDRNTIQLPILADVPAGLPDYSDRDIEIFKDIPRDMFPGADFIIRCIGDSLSPKFEIGDFCVIRKQIEPMHGKAMLVETENGYCMKVINKTDKGVQLCSINKKYKPFYPKQLRIVGLIIGLWARTDKENLLEIA